MIQYRLSLHIGAHKTASTYLQERLALNRARLADEGIAYWPLNSVRPVLREALRPDPALTGRSALSFFSRFRPDVTAQRAGERLVRWCALDMPVVISDENIIGESAGCHSGTFYPAARDRLERLDALLPERPVEIWLCVRSYPDFLASIYGEALRHGSFLDLPRFLERNASPRGQWVQLVDAVRRAMPDAPLVVWPYEQFRALENEILLRFTGMAAEHFRSVAQQDVLPSASGEAIRRMIDVAPSLAPVERIFKMLALRNRYPLRDRQDRFDPWEADVRAAMQEDYAVDLAQLHHRGDVEVLGEVTPPAA